MHALLSNLSQQERATLAHLLRALTIVDKR
jgi:hypothetical protein